MCLRARTTCTLSPGLVWLPEAPVEPPRETSLSFQITFRRDHLEACLLSLGCDVMARERSNFETYSMCYEHVLQHAREKLSQREQVGTKEVRTMKEKGCGHGGLSVIRQRISEQVRRAVLMMNLGDGEQCPPYFFLIGSFSWVLALSVVKLQAAMGL